LMNLSVPLIDAWTQPRIYGGADRHGKEPPA
jgi:Na+-translocating ferredoxin:NAD+ oxidoreductase RnfD subunit